MITWPGKSNRAVGERVIHVCRVAGDGASHRQIQTAREIGLQRNGSRRAVACDHHRWQCAGHAARLAVRRHGNQRMDSRLQDCARVVDLNRGAGRDRHRAVSLVERCVRSIDQQRQRAEVAIVAANQKSIYGTVRQRAAVPQDKDGAQSRDIKNRAARDDNA